SCLCTFIDFVLVTLFSSFMSLLFNASATSDIFTLSLHDALPIYIHGAWLVGAALDEASFGGVHQRPNLGQDLLALFPVGLGIGVDRKSTRLNSSHVKISYAVFCLKKKKIKS